MKRLQKQGSSNDIDELIMANDHVVNVVTSTSDHEFSKGSPEDRNNWDGGSPAEPPESYTYGDMTLSVDLVQLEQITGITFSDEQINQYINNLRACKKPEDMELLVGFPIYDAVDYNSTLTDNHEDEEVSEIEVSNNNKKLTIKFNYIFDGPWDNNSELDEDSYRNR